MQGCKCDTLPVHEECQGRQNGGGAKCLACPVVCVFGQWHDVVAQTTTICGVARESIVDLESVGEARGCKWQVILVSITTVSGVDDGIVDLRVF